MITQKTAIVAVALFLGASSPAVAETFEWILDSVSKAGSLSNGDGHQWKFEGNDGNWKVKGARNKSAGVTSAGENKIKIDGFPYNWGANGVFNFSRTSGKCVLKSDHSVHRLKWNCK